MLETLPGYDSWKLMGPAEPRCDLDHENCPNRFECAIGWPFEDEFDEAESRLSGTFEQTIEEVC